MKKLVLLLLIAALWLVPSGVSVSSAAAPTAAQRVVYKTYTNARYGYSISYPMNLLIPQGEAENGDGQAFRARDGAAEMLVYGSQNLGGGIEGAFREAQEGKSVTYKTLRRNWFVVSGHDGGKIFYRKTIFKGGVFKTFSIEYDESRRATYDAVTVKVARSFVG